MSFFRSKPNYDQYLVGMSDESKTDFLKHAITQEQLTERERCGSVYTDGRWARAVTWAVAGTAVSLILSIAGYHVASLWRDVRVSASETEKARINADRPACSFERCAEVMQCSTSPKSKKD